MTKTFFFIFLGALSRFFMHVLYVYRVTCWALIVWLEHINFVWIVQFLLKESMFYYNPENLHKE